MKFGIRTTLATKPSKDNSYSVIIRVSYKSSRIELYTGITLKQSHWSANKCRVKHGAKVNGMMYNVLNDTLTEMEKFVEDYFNNSALRSTLPSLADLKARFKKKFTSSAKEQSDEFFFVYGEFIKETSSLKGWTDERAETMKRLEKKLRDYKADIKFSDLTTSTLDGFKEYLAKTMYNDAIKKHLQYLSQFINWAYKRRYPIHEDYFSYQPVLPIAKKAVRYLTLKELDDIYNLNLEGREGLERSRDIFLFQCYTALRDSDMRNVKRENIYIAEDGNYYIDLLTEKDDDRIHFRLPKRAVEMYRKYENNVYENDLAFPVISQQKYNEHLKDIGKAANLQGEWRDHQYRLNEKITIYTPKHQLSSHTARRTFVVTALNEGVPLEIVALITSHSDVRAMKPYIKALGRGTDKVIDAIDKAVVKEDKEK